MHGDAAAQAPADDRDARVLGAHAVEHELGVGVERALGR